MLSLNLFLKVTVLLVVALSFAGCRSPKRETPPPAAPPPSKVKFNAKYDAEIKEILALARANEWETAEQKATDLLKQEPDNPSLERVYGWVIQESKLRRAKALEDEIRDINTRDSVFSPTPRSLLLERKNRGLPPRKDLRDAVEQIEGTPYVPDTYGRTIQQKGPLYEFDTARGRMSEVLDKEISLHFDNVPLEHIIFTIGQAHGINFVADKAIPAFQQRLSVNMEKVRFGEFLNYVSRNLDVQFQVGPDLIWIVDGKDPKSLLEETRFYRLRKGFVIPAQFAPTETTKVTVTVPATNTRTETETQKIEKFVRDTAPDKPSIETAIKQFFTGSSYYVDYERNLIVARGTHDQLLILERIIEEFDKPLQQVLIEARFITVSQAAFLQLGATWETGRGTIGDRSPADFTGLGDNIGTLGLGLQESFTNILSRGNLSATLTALEQSGESQTLSAPRITLVNNLPATISDGKIQYYYEEYSVKTQILERRSASTLVPTGKPAKLTSGVSLDVLASIGGDGRSIMLALKPEVNQDVRLVPFATVTDLDEAGRVASSFEIRLPESRTQSLATRVIVQSGQTVVMGGVLEREQRTFVESVPILGSIPILGAAFRKRTELDRPRYLLIFVTATLVSDSGEFLSYDESD